MDAFVDLTLQNIGCKTTAHILGVSMGVVPRSTTAEEKTRQTKVRRLAKRIGTLPVSKQKKNALAVSILAPNAAWGVLFNGRCPTEAEVSAYAMSWRGATQGFHHLGGHDARTVSRALQQGHWSDLRFLAVQRFTTALHRWRKRHPDMWQHDPSCIMALRKTLDKLGCIWHSSGHFSFHNGSWDISAPLELIGKAQHLFRQAWRRAQFDLWLQSDRRDSGMAREAGLTISTDLIDKLRKFTQTATADQAAVMCGGLTTAAQWNKGGPPLRNHCPDCCLPVCPGTEHVYWHCPVWDELRILPQPINDSVLSRLGWNEDGPNESLICQMAKIRSSHAEAARKRRASVTPQPAPAAAGLLPQGGGPGH